MPVWRMARRLLMMARYAMPTAYRQRIARHGNTNRQRASDADFRVTLYFLLIILRHTSCQRDFRRYMLIAAIDISRRDYLP